MDLFTSALISKFTTKIPPEFDWFAPLIGDWDFSYHDSHNGIRRPTMESQAASWSEKALE